MSGKSTVWRTDPNAIVLPHLLKRPDVPPDEWDEWIKLDTPPIGCHVVTPKSEQSARSAVYRCAVFFRREFRYDFTQYDKRETDPTSRAYIWMAGSTGGWLPVIGACSFRWREWTDAPAGWALQWVWFHPYERNRGHLSRAWPYFKQRFGDFFLEPPISKHMASFLAKHEVNSPVAGDAPGR